MYHGAGYRKLGKKTAHRLAMFSNMATSLLEHERIQTTLPKAKELRRIVERLVTKGKGGTDNDRRLAFSMLRSKDAVEKLFKDIAPRFKDRNGGYIRILKTAHNRVGDAAPMAFVEFVDYVLPSQKSSEDSKKDSASKKAKAKESEKSDKAAKAARKASNKESNAAKKAAKAGRAGASSTMKGSGSRGS
jgi:large subunit ribosomal protein L17